MSHPNVRPLVAVIAGLSAAAMVAMVTASTSTLAGTPGGDDLALQVESGGAIYDSVCVRCHGVEGECGEGPALVGPRALRSFRTAKRLYDYVSLSMPGDAPGSLSEQEYYDVIAFLLDWNELNPDGVVVDADSLEDLALQ